MLPHLESLGRLQQGFGLGGRDQSRSMGLAKCDPSLHGRTLAAVSSLSMASL